MFSALQGVSFTSAILYQPLESLFLIIGFFSFPPKSEHSPRPILYIFSFSFFIAEHPPVFLVYPMQLTLKYLLLIPLSSLRSRSRMPHVLIQQEFVEQMDQQMNK